MARQHDRHAGDNGVTRRMLLRMAAAGAGALTIPTIAWGQDAPVKGGILRISAANNPSTMDPHTGRSGFDYAMLFPIFDTLIEFDFATLQALPGLAKSWSIDDPNKLVLTLNEGIRFHDGTTLDAEAVKFNLERAMTDERSNVKTDIASIDTVEVTGPLEVTLNLKHPDSSLVLILSDRAGMIISPKAIQEMGTDTDRQPVGAGAWKFVSWTDNAEVVMARNEDYWRPDRPYLDGIHFAIIPETNTGLRSVVAGENDLTFGLTSQQIPVIQRSADTVDFVTGPTQILNMLYFNFDRPTIGNIKVRQALNMAVNREAFNSITQDGEAAWTSLPSVHWAFDPAMVGYFPYDPDRAKALLAEAGFADGFDLDAVGWNDQKAVQRQEILIEQFGAVGIRTKFTTASVADATTMFNADKKGDVFLGAFTGRPDPSQIFSRLFDKNSFLNPAHLDLAEGRADAQLETQSTAVPEERIAAFHKLQKAVAENALFCPLTFSYDVTAFAKKVKGYQGNLSGKPKFNAVYIVE